MMYAEGNYHTCKKWFLFFIVGFVAGMMLINFKSSLFAGENGIFNATSLNRLKYLEIESGAFFRYVTARRLKDYLMLGLLSTTCFGILASYGAAAWQGMMTGMVITVAIIRFGLKGLILVMTSFFPHQLILIPAGVMMLLWCYQNCSMLYFGGRNIWMADSKKKYYVRQLMMLFWILTVVIIGCVLESYVNPILIADIVKFF